MSEHEHIDGGGSSVAGWSVIVVSLLAGLWIFATFPLSWTHTDISDTGTTTHTGACSGPGAVTWTPNTPSDPSGIQQAESYCSTWSGAVVLIAAVVAVAGCAIGAWLVTRRTRSGDPAADTDAATQDAEEPAAV